VVIEFANAISAQEIDALEQRHRVSMIERRASQLTGTTLLRSRILDHRAVTAVVRALETDPVVLSAQPNYRFALQQKHEARSAGGNEPLQYAATKLRLPEAHQLANGGNVLVAVIDSGVDTSHPELAGAIVGTFNTFQAPGEPHSHGTAIAALITAHVRLIGSAPAAGILAARAFDTAGHTAQGSTFNILKALDWRAIRPSGAGAATRAFGGPS